MEVHHPLSGLIRCVTMLELGNQPWRTEAVAGYPVRTMFQQDETFVAAYGQTATERRASRVELWAHSNQFSGGTRGKRAGGYGSHCFLDGP